MNLKEKLDLFIKGELLADEVLSQEMLISQEVKLKSKVNNLLFEKNISLQSTVLPTKDLVFLGSYSYMNEDGYIRGPAFIGRYCSIGRRVSIGAGMHSFSGLSSHPLLSSGSVRQTYSTLEIELLGLKDRRSIGVVIGSDVWIGDGAVILPGVTIGEGAVIGANTVVNKDVAPYSIIGGLPAKLLRLRFTEDICLALSNTRWWEYDIESTMRLDYKNIFKYLQVDRSSEQFVSNTTFKNL